MFVSLCECASLRVCVCAHLGVGVSRVFLLWGRAALCPRSARAGLACAASLPSSPWRLVVQGAPQVPVAWDPVATGSRLFRGGTRLGFGLCHFLLCDLGPVSWLLWSLLLHLPEERDAAAHLTRLGDWAQGNAWVWRCRYTGWRGQAGHWDPRPLCQGCASLPQWVGTDCCLNCVFVIYTDVQTELEAGHTPLEVLPHLQPLPPSRHTYLY